MKTDLNEREAARENGEILTLKGAAALAGVSSETIRRAIEAKKLKAANFNGKSIRILRSDIYSLFQVQ